MLALAAIGLHWLANTDPATDLCAHAGIRVSRHGAILMDAATDELAVSTGALHLLRTIEVEHTVENPLAEHLIPHCGHFMAIDDATLRVANIGCNRGVNWWVRHDQGSVILDFGGNSPIQLALSEWSAAIASFSDTVEAYYTESDFKRPHDDYDATWYTAFRAEWSDRRAAVRCAV